MKAFGSGTLYGLPNAGDLAANPTARKFGVVQDCQIDISGDIKELYGQYQFPVDTAVGKRKITFKAKYAQIIAAQFNDLFFAETLGTTERLVAVDEAQSVPGVSTYIITTTNAAKFKLDLGVIYAASGLPLTQVTAGSEALGKYSVNQATGVYTFAAADASAAVIISYEYDAATGTGLSIPITNRIMGYGPIFAMILAMSYRGNTLNVQLNACRANKLTLATKQDDFMIPEFDGAAFADAAGNIGNIWISQ